MVTKIVTAASTTSPSPTRITLLDVARGIALVAMAVYHFSWDLEYFGWMAPGTAVQGGWLIFARSIATSFLFLVGVSLVLAHAQGIRWRGFWVRFVQVAGAAALISAVTWFIPGGFIFFGILHAIALFSLIGLIFVAVPWSFAVATAVVIYGIWLGFTADLFAHPTLWWIGLATVPTRANDYVPLFPWLAPVLIGIAFAQLLQRFSLWQRIAQVNLPSIAQRPLSSLGRHSLVFYLVHQPILIGLVYLFTTFIAQPDYATNFVSQCEKSCSNTRGEQFCKAYCGCMIEEMSREEILTPFMSRSMSEDQNNLLLDMRDMCVANHE